jgi:SAM-dependent methyltransferase
VSKHRVLTDAEFRQFRLNPRTLTYLERHREALGLAPGEMRVLDWGCGRGRTVLGLRELGYDAHGVDIDEEPVRNGRPLFREKGHPEDALRVLRPDGTTGFSDGFFHFVCSDQVFEHVADIEIVAREQRRILRPDGAGFHQYPGHLYLVEGHLYMPLVHWLPKSGLRRLAILFYVWAGREPRWDWLDGRGVREKARAYYDYSVRNTFYRTYSQVRDAFERHGFRVSFETINHPGLSDYPLLYRLAQRPWARPLLSRILLTFKGVELRVAV